MAARMRSKKICTDAYGEDKRETISDGFFSESSVQICYNKEMAFTTNSKLFAANKRKWEKFPF